MLTFITVFWILVGVIAVIGAMRGWAKELINIFGVVLGLTLYDLVMTYVPFVRTFLDQMQINDPVGGQRLEFLLTSGGFLMIVFFAYLGPVAARQIGGKAQVKARETLQDALLGFILGAVNGYLIVGTIWFFLHVNNYPFPDSMMTRPEAGTASAEFVQLLPMVWIQPYLKFLLPASVLLLLIMFV
jgi:uncharacterized membrane protein required for colicin V production